MTISPELLALCGDVDYASTEWAGSCGEYGEISDTEPPTGSTDPNAVYIKYNNTLMKDYNTATCNDFVPPFATLPEVQYTPYCVPDYDCGNCTNGLNWCFVNTDPSYFYGGNGTTHVSFAVNGEWNNTYSQSNDTASNECADTRALGFKNVYASKIWQGIHSYTSNVHGKAECWDWCGDGCAHTEVDLSVDGTKYRTISAWATWDVDTVYWGGNCTSTGLPYECCCYDQITGERCVCGSGGDCSPAGGGTCYCYTCTELEHFFWGGAASSTCTVDIYGNTRYTCASSSYGANDYGQCDNPFICGGDPECEAACLAEGEAEMSAYVFGLLSAVNSNWTSLPSIFAGIVDYAGMHGGLGVPTRVTEDGCGSWTLEYDSQYTCLCTDGCGCLSVDPVDYVSDRVTITPTSLNHTHMGVSIGGHYLMDEDYCTDDPTCREVFEEFNKTWTYSGTSFNYTERAKPNYYNPSAGSVDIEINGTLSDAYTSADVYAEIVALLGKWDMGDPKVYPWRTDSAKTLGPYVHYDEVVGVPYIGNCTDSTGSTGAVMGAPGPEGIDRVWNPLHRNYCVCESYVQPGCYSMYVGSYGAWSTDCGVPRATEWMELQAANGMPDGAMCGQGFMWTMPNTCNSTGPVKMTGDPVLWGCKYAEVIFPKQGMNYNRPCGADRWTLTSSYEKNCVASVAGNVLTLNSNLSETVYINSTNYAYVCGVSESVDGVHECTVAGYNVTLTKCIASASWFPFQPITNCGTGFVGVVRSKGVVPICGTIAIASVAASASKAVITLAEPSWLTENDYIYVKAVTGSAINGYWKVSVKDNKTYVLVGVPEPTGSYTGGYVQSSFAPDSKWNNNDTRNEFQVRQWHYNYRDVGEFYRVEAQALWNSGLAQSCCPNPGCGDTCPTTCNCPQPSVPAHPRQNQCGLDENVITMSCVTGQLCPSVCSPNVAYFSPNYGSESFGSNDTGVVSSINYGFRNPGMDSNYGTMWQGIIVQTMDDPYYVAPPCPCIHYTNDDPPADSFECDPDTSWVMDNGSCQADVYADPELGIQGYSYYPRTPFYEARCEVPTGASPFIPPIKIGCVTQANPDCVGKNVCSAPYGPATFPEATGCGNTPYLVYVYENPWVLLLTEEACVCGAGRFAANYAANGVGDGGSITCPSPPEDDSEVLPP